MSDWFQTIVDIEATPNEAEQLGTSVLAWLVQSGIVAAERGDCVLGSDFGYPPGRDCADAVTEPDPTLTDLRTNGLDIIVGRSVFDCGQDGIERATCPHCGTIARFVNDEWELLGHVWEPFSQAVSEWYEGGDGFFNCSNCARQIALNDWLLEPPWGFGHLGFTFWNWPPLKPEFVAELSRRLGHKTVCPTGKL